MITTKSVTLHKFVTTPGRYISREELLITKLVPANLGNQMHLLAQLFLFKLLRELKQNEYFLLASSYSLKKSISGEFWKFHSGKH